MTKFCKDCEHYFPEGAGNSKLLPGCDQAHRSDLVTGKPMLASAYDMRDARGPCKPEARLWEKKALTVKWRAG